MTILLVVDEFEPVNYDKFTELRNKGRITFVGTMTETGIIILAAGSASRFGNIKQLLPFKGKTLLRHVIDEAAEAGLGPILVVTGANAGEVADSIGAANVDTIYNESWQQGKASSIVAGVRGMTELHPSVRNILVVVCDQPFVTASLFSRMVQMQKESGKDMVASAYAGTVGTPVLFSQKYFDALLGLKGDEGARKLLMTFGEDLATVDFPEGHIDVDTKDDYEDLLRHTSP